jgi:hypothetical protein
MLIYMIILCICHSLYMQDKYTYTLILWSSSRPKSSHHQGSVGAGMSKKGSPEPPLPSYLPKQGALEPQRQRGQTVVGQMSLGSRSRGSQSRLEVGGDGYIQHIHR